jgi:hypothetical protein
MANPGGQRHFLQRPDSAFQTTQFLKQHSWIQRSATAKSGALVGGKAF